MADRSLIFITNTEALRDGALYEKALGLIDAGRRERVLKVRHEGSGRQMVAAGVLLQYAVREYVKCCRGVYDENSGGTNRRNVCDAISGNTSAELTNERSCEWASVEFAEAINAGSGRDEVAEAHRASDQPYIFTEARKASGQPYLPDYPDLYISLSHSGARAMCGISDAPIGVDIQEHSERREVMDIAKRFFHEEEVAYLESISDPEHRRTEFYRLWCLHEAYVKNTGNGLSEGFKDVTFLDAVKGDGKLSDNKAVHLIDSIPSYSAAVVKG